mgnify:CR=1 FL=1
MSKAATADSYSKNMLHQKVFRTIICILFCIIALLPFVLLVMNATRDSESIKAGVSLIPSTHLIENWKNLMIKQNGMQITLQKQSLTLQPLQSLEPSCQFTFHL